MGLGIRIRCRSVRLTIEDAGHIIVQDKPEEFEAVIRKFLAS